MKSRETKQPPSALREFLKRLALVAGCAFILVMIPLTIIIAPDQIRPISESSLFETRVAEESGGEIDETKGSILESGDLPDESSSNQNPKNTLKGREWAWYWLDEDGPSVDELRRAVLPFPDMATVPSDWLTTARLCNQMVDDATSRLLALPAIAKGLSEKDLWTRWGENNSQYYRAYDMAFPDRADEKYSRVPEERYDLMNRADLGIAVERENWERAASQCLWRAGGMAPDKTSIWWQRGVYFHRKCGIAGRTVLAFYSLQPTFRPVFRPLLPAINKIGPVVYEGLKRVDSFLDKTEPEHEDSEIE